MHKKALFTTAGVITAIIIIIMSIFVIATQNQNRKEAEQQREIENTTEVVKEDASKESDDGMIYDDDGTVNTSNWQECFIGKGRFLCPPYWIISGNVIYNTKNTQERLISKKGDLYIEVNAALLDEEISGVISEDAILQNDIADHKKRYSSCMQKTTIKGIYFFECETEKNSSNYYEKNYSKWSKIILDNKKMHYERLTFSVYAYDRATYEKNKNMIDQVISTFVSDGVKFIFSK